MKAPIILALMAAIAALPAAAAPRGATVAYAQGEVRVNGAPAEIGSGLGPSFSVATGPGARCDIVFDGGNVLSVGQNTAARVDLSGEQGILLLDKGGVTSVLKKLAKLAGKDAFQVRTSSVVAGVRGTSFCVWADGDSTYVCACNGAVRTLDAKGGNELELVSAHHTARIYARMGAGFSVVVAGMLHHDDALVESAAARIGWKVDWKKVDR